MHYSVSAVITYKLPFNFLSQPIIYLAWSLLPFLYPTQTIVTLTALLPLIAEAYFKAV